MMVLRLSGISAIYMFHNSSGVLAHMDEAANGKQGGNMQLLFSYV